MLTFYQSSDIISYVHVPYNLYTLYSNKLYQFEDQKRRNPLQTALQPNSKLTDA